MKKISKFMDGRKTYTGLILMVLPFALSRIGVEIPDIELQAFASNLVETIGFLLAVYGRYKANA